MTARKSRITRKLYKADLQLQVERLMAENKSLEMILKVQDEQFLELNMIPPSSLYYKYNSDIIDRSSSPQSVGSFPFNESQCEKRTCTRCDCEIRSPSSSSPSVSSQDSNESDDSCSNSSEDGFEYEPSINA
jgi:hypothetical protein